MKPPKPHLCQPHTRGVPFNAPPFFYADCAKCQAKKAAGEVRGDEGTIPNRWNKQPVFIAPRPMFVLKWEKDR